MRVTNGIQVAHFVVDENKSHSESYECMSSASPRICLYTNVAYGSETAVGLPRMDFIARTAGTGHFRSLGRLEYLSVNGWDYLKSRHTLVQPAPCTRGTEMT
jgi:hypothetical protein